MEGGESCGGKGSRNTYSLFGGRDSAPRAGRDPVDFDAIIYAITPYELQGKLEILKERNVQMYYSREGDREILHIQLGG